MSAPSSVQEKNEMLKMKNYSDPKNMKNYNRQLLLDYISFDVLSFYLLSTKKRMRVKRKNIYMPELLWEELLYLTWCFGMFINIGDSSING